MTTNEKLRRLEIFEDLYHDLWDRYVLDPDYDAFTEMRMTRDALYRCSERLCDLRDEVQNDAV